MQDGLGRNINYLRISLTDRCNLRCRYCMPEQGVDIRQHDEMLRLEEITRVVEIAGTLGIRKVRLTGGEPLIRRNLVKLIVDIAAKPCIDDVALTTNGLLLKQYARELKEAGLNRINMSLDSLKPDRYAYITRGGALEKALEGLESALSEGLHPVKINCVAIADFNDDEIDDFCRLAYEYPIHVRFIEFMPVGELSFWQNERVLRCGDIMAQVQERYQLTPAKLQSSGPARSYLMQGGKGSIGFISPMSNHFCASCNRLRLTADGKLRACLYSGAETDLKPALRGGAEDRDIAELMARTITAKPDRHAMDTGAWGQDDRKMFQIGG